MSLHLTLEQSKAFNSLVSAFVRRHTHVIDRMINHAKNKGGAPIHLIDEVTSNYQSFVLEAGEMLEGYTGKECPEFNHILLQVPLNMSKFDPSTANDVGELVCLFVDVYQEPISSIIDYASNLKATLIVANEPQFIH